MKVAFYKGKHKEFFAALYSYGVRKWTKSKYSHCELIFNDEIAASSSFKDGGVRYIKMEFPDADWDFVELPDCYETAARQWFDEHAGEKYDVIGNIHFLLSPIGNAKRKWFCSEAVGASLGLKDSWRYDPGALFTTLNFLTEHVRSNDL